MIFRNHKSSLSSTCDVEVVRVVQVSLRCVSGLHVVGLFQRDGFGLWTVWREETSGWYPAGGMKLDKTGYLWYWERKMLTKLVY